MKNVLPIALAAIALWWSFASSRGSVTASSTARDVAPLQLEEQIPVPNVAGRLDHFTADVKRKRLFVSALGRKRSRDLLPRCSQTTTT